MSNQFVSGKTGRFGSLLVGIATALGLGALSAHYAFGAPSVNGHT
jgi:hypothetical protein